MSFYGHFLGFGVEVTPGSAVARTLFSKAYPGTFLRQQIPREPATFLGARSPETMFDGPSSCVGKIITPWVYDGMAEFLEHLFGKMVTAGAGPYTRTFTLDQRPFSRTSPTALTALSAELMLDIPQSGFESAIAAGMRCTEFGGEFRQGNEVRFDADFVGSSVVLGAKSTGETFPDLATEWLKPSQIAFTIDGAVLPVLGFTFRCNHNMNTEKANLGQTGINSPTPAAGKQLVTGTIEIDWNALGTAADSKTLYDKFVSGATATIICTSTGSGNRIGVFTFQNVQFTGQTPEPAEGGELPQKLPFLSLNHATKTALEYVETNDTAP
ncbi:MAG: hypothetical protein GY715_14260 [Planctomycetes bacterium]|nr:hypothetical protein [Planctomycetota bacterium]